MHSIDIHTFCNFSDSQIHKIGPMSWHRCATDSCLLTCNDTFTLIHCVLASDGRMYDASSLQKWLCLRKRQGETLEVIPNCPIENVVCCMFAEAYLRMCVYIVFWKVCGSCSPAMLGLI